jgi:hypothetical protein
MPAPHFIMTPDVAEVHYCNHRHAPKYKLAAIVFRSKAADCLPVSSSGRYDDPQQICMAGGAPGTVYNEILEPMVLFVKTSGANGGG